MSYDVVVIGAGLAGLTAALRLAGEGRRVLVVAKGVGATHLSPPTIDVLGYNDGPVESPARAMTDFAGSHPEHPYARLGVDLIAESIEWFKARLAGQGYRGDVEANYLLPTAAGAAKPSAVVPESMAAGDLRAAGSYVFVGLRGLKDFYPSYLADNLRRALLPSGEPVFARAVELEPPLGGEGDVSSIGFARRFEQPGFRDAVVRELGPQLVAGELVGFPAVLGLEHAHEVRDDLERRLGHAVFEVPTLPPSVPGIRLFETMKAALRRGGGRLVLGSEVVGAVDADGRVEGVQAQTAARTVTYHARSFVLASGGFASGGLHLDSHGKIRETVFDLPLGFLPEPGRPRFAPGYFDEHPISRTGVAVDAKLRPVDRDSAPVYENVHGAGATLGGAVPWQEASGNGLSLATGYAAAAAILEPGS